MKLRVPTRPGLPVALRVLPEGRDAQIDWSAEVVSVPDGFVASGAAHATIAIDDTSAEQRAVVRWRGLGRETHTARSDVYLVSMASAGDEVLAQGPDGRWSRALVIANPTPAMIRLAPDGVSVEITPAPRRHTPYVDLAGLVFGRWTVLRYAAGLARQAWWCRCACGDERIVETRHLWSGRSAQCRACADEQRRSGGARASATGG